MPTGSLDPKLEKLVADAYEKGTPIPILLAQQAAQAGSVKGMVVYGIGTGNAGHLEEAKQWLQRARQAGDSFAMLALGTLYLDQGDLDSAERYFREAQLNGQAGAADALGALRAAQRTAPGRPELARPSAFGPGKPQAPPPPAAPAPAPAPAVRRGRRGWLRRGKAQQAASAVTADEAAALVNLGVMLRQQGDLDGAEQCYLRATSAGDVDAMNNLGNLLKQRGRLDEAVRWWKTAAAAGSGDSQASYGAYQAELGDWDKAEYWWRLAAEQGNLTGIHNLALSLTRRGRSAEAEHWLRLTEGNEYTDAPPSRQAEAEPEDLTQVSAWLSSAADRGNADARAALEQLERDWPA